MNSTVIEYFTFCHFSLFVSFLFTPTTTAEYQSFSVVLYLNNSCGNTFTTVTGIIFQSFQTLVISFLETINPALFISIFYYSLIKRKAFEITSLL